MLTKNYISKSLPFLALNDDGNKALDIMDDYMLSELPVIEENNYLGLLQSKDIFDYNLFDEKMQNIRQKIHHIFINENQHVFDAFKMMHLYNLTLLPVLNSKDHYIGSITNTVLINNLAQTVTVKEEGFFLMITIEKKDFSLSEISNIIERNNGKILGMFIDSINENEQMIVFIKIFTQDIDDIIQSLDKFNYDAQIINYQESETNEMYNQRLENLIKFIKT